MTKTQRDIFDKLKRGVYVTKGQYPAPAVKDLVDKGYVAWCGITGRKNLSITKKGIGFLVRRGEW
jgi:predicted transcriptional regulator